MKKSFYLIYRCVLCLALMSGLVSCDDDLQDEFSRYPALFRFPMVNTTPQLRSALNDPGMFCKITFPPQLYLFTDAQGKSTPVNRTSLEAYGKPTFISGFIVGTPALPDNMSGSFFNVAFDLVCPLCYESKFIERELDFNGTVATEMKCARCGSIYDLNNNGIIKNNEGNYKLYRYRMSYNKVQGSLMIHN